MNLPKEEYCKVIRKNVSLDSFMLPTACRYFRIRNNKPICLRILFGRMGPNPFSAIKIVLKSIYEPFLLFTAMSLGQGRLPHWWCKLCAGDLKYSKLLEYLSKAPGLIISNIDDDILDSLSNLKDKLDKD